MQYILSQKSFKVSIVCLFLIDFLSKRRLVFAIDWLIWRLTSLVRFFCAHKLKQQTRKSINKRKMLNIKVEVQFGRLSFSLPHLTEKAISYLYKEMPINDGEFLPKRCFYNFIDFWVKTHIPNRSPGPVARRTRDCAVQSPGRSGWSGCRPARGDRSDGQIRCGIDIVEWRSREKFGCGSSCRKDLPRDRWRPKKNKESFPCSSAVQKYDSINRIFNQSVYQSINQSTDQAHLSKSERLIEGKNIPSNQKHSN